MPADAGSPPRFEADAGADRPDPVGAAGQPAAAPDQLISHYRIVGSLGEGGMGEVYAGVDETLRRRVALKALRPEKRLDPHAKARFLREARILSQLEHAHICRVYDYIETADRAWLVLELIEGENLRVAIKRGLRPFDKLQVALQIAEVLVVTHAAGVVHRDLKPTNVMRTRTGDVKVLDFGISARMPARASATEALSEPAPGEDVDGSLDETRLPVAPAAPDLDLSHYQSQAGVILGTLTYMSPEQARGESATSASDMYSFGLLLQELFTGRRPYADTSDYLALLTRVKRGDSSPHIGMPGPLAALVGRLKALPPAQRPTAVETLDRLRWIVDAPRRRRRNLAVAIILIGMLLGAVKYTVDLSRERTAAVLARNEADRRREQAEDLISFMVGDLRGRLSAVGRLEILDEVGKKALAYFASVPADQLTGEELYRRSQAMHQLGQVRQARADLTGALQAYEESLTQASDLVRRDPGNTKWQLGLGTSHFYVGDAKRLRGDFEGALAHFREYQEIARQLVSRDPDNFEWKLELSYGHSNVAAILSGRGDFLGARGELLRTQTLQDELARVKPEDITLQTSRANNANRLGIVLERLGDLEGAAASFERELALYEALIAKDPNNTRYLRRVVVSRQFLGPVLKAMGKRDDARAHLQTSFLQARALVSLDPTNADWQRDAANAGNAVARIMLESGQTVDALQQFRSSLGTLRPLAARNPEQPSRQRDVALAVFGIAIALFASGATEAALQEVDTAQATLDRLLVKAPRNVDAARDVALCENLRGRIWSSKRDAARARAAWSRSVTVLAPLAAESTDRNVLDPWVRALLYLGRIDEARAGFERLSRLGYRDRDFLNEWSEHAKVRPAG